MLGFRRISIQDQLIDQVEEFIKKHGCYRSIAEFVSEAVRLRLEQLTQKMEVDVA